MKDILKMMRFDFISAQDAANKTAPNAFTAVVLVVTITAAVLFLFPGFSLAVTGAAGALIVPLQSAKKDDLGRLYGTLPVGRKNITRARFLYIFVTHVVSTAASLVIAFAAVLLNLNRFLPKDNDTVKILSESYSMEEFTKLVPALIGFGTFFCLVFAFMEMMGQIHGRENEMKIFIILLASIVVMVMGGVFILGQLGYPEIKLPDMPLWAGLTVTTLAVLGICMLFGEITAAKLAKREL